MKKLLIILVIILAVALLLFSCEPRPTVHNTKLYEVYHVVDANALHCDSLDTMKVDKVYELEQDQYGRRLFRYCPHSWILGLTLDVYVIVQENSNSEVGYYQDYCWMARRSYVDPATEDEISTLISTLKEINDWGKPLDRSKITYIPNESTKPLIHATDTEKAFAKYLGLGENAHLVFNEMERYGPNRQLYAVRIVEKDGDEVILDVSYLAVINLDIEGYIEVCEEFEPVLDCQDVVHEFREKYLSN